MLHRRTMLLGTAAAVIAGCTGVESDSVTVQDILNYLRDKCQFRTNLQAIIDVIVTMVAGFDASAGAGAVVAANIAKLVQDTICAAVEQRVAQARTEDRIKLTTPLDVRIVVNGVVVEGEYTGA